MNDEQFRRLLSHFDRSWHGYRKVRKGVKKRIGRHMNLLGCRNMEAYLARLDRSETERRVCEEFLAVSISRFFRDRQLWWALENRLLPSLSQRATPPFTVWSAGCSCGEEAYSFAMVWDRAKRNLPGPFSFLLLATDIRLPCLAHARDGIYPESSLREVPDELLETYFERMPGGKRYRIAPSLKKGVVWMAHDLFSQAPAVEFDIIFLRNNLLTYHADAIKGPATARIVEALSPSGLLVIGAHESFPGRITGLEPVSEHPSVFRKSSKPV